MQKPRLKTPVLVYMYGLPGSGKTYIARELCQMFNMAHISSDRLRFELFDKPKHENTENQIIANLMDYSAELLLSHGVSVVYDISVSRLGDRKVLREVAQKLKVKELMVWVQVDVDTAWTRNQSIHKSAGDEQYAAKLDRPAFENYMHEMQNPINENYLVLSGKHLFNSHKNAFIRRFKEIGILDEESLNPKIAKPELVNLVSKAQAQVGRVDYTRRNINL